ncbi:GIY-YIG nuclease family protein [Gryllotalpicola kribbensis]|uniref:GIY-YIG nuclease family protein n=1 Tax=Gryllotalpicola kribbensis TaxID=993084 RepID=A0ABP8AKH1_9MICO
MPAVYMLECGDGSFYVGSTRNLEARIQQHMVGAGSEYTRWRMPVKLVWAMELDSVADAYALEKQIQGWGRAKRIALIEGRFGDLKALAKKKFGKPPAVE